MLNQRETPKLCENEETFLQFMANNFLHLLFAALIYTAVEILLGHYIYVRQDRRRPRGE